MRIKTKNKLAVATVTLAAIGFAAPVAHARVLRSEAADLRTAQPETKNENNPPSDLLRTGEIVGAIFLAAFVASQLEKITEKSDRWNGNY